MRKIIILLAILFAFVVAVPTLNEFPDHFSI
jgi:hypothetical protein